MKRFLLALSIVAVFTNFAVCGRAAMAADNAPVFAPGDKAFGKSLANWGRHSGNGGSSTPLAGHPFTDDPSFDFAARQSGPVWFWGAPFGVVTREVTIPAGKAILLSMLDVEASTLEEPPFFGSTAAEQAAIARFYANRIGDLFLTIDGEEVRLISPPTARPARR